MRNLKTLLCGLCWADTDEGGSMKGKPDWQRRQGKVLVTFRVEPHPFLVDSENATLQL